MPFDTFMKTPMKRILAGLTALIIAALVWLPCLHFFFTRPVSDFRRDEGLSPKARQLAARHLQLWTEPALREQELEKMRASNAEWDFMGRIWVGLLVACALCLFFGQTLVALLFLVCAQLFPRYQRKRAAPSESSAIMPVGK
jgi:hypothetical protein